MSSSRAAGGGIWLEGLGEVDRVSVGIQDVRYMLAPGHVARRAENPAAEDIDVFQQALHVPDAQVGDVDVEEYPLRGGDVGVPVGHHAELGVADLQAHVEGRAVLRHAGDLNRAEQCLVEREQQGQAWGHYAWLNR